MHFKVFTLGEDHRPTSMDRRWKKFRLGEDKAQSQTQYNVTRLGEGKLIQSYFNPWLKR